jgi:hypothetical protein
MRLLTLVCLLALCACKGASPAPATETATGTPATAAAPAAAPVAVDPAKVDAFWTWFQAHAAELRADKDYQHTMESISAELEKVHPGVFAEIGGTPNGDPKLVISVDGKKDLFPVVQAVYAKRPSVPGWAIVAFRQRDTGMKIDMGGKTLDPATITFAAQKGRLLDLTLYVPAYDKSLDQALFVLLDHVVGEYDMETKIGGIEFAPLDRAPSSARPLTELPAAVDAVP